MEVPENGVFWANLFNNCDIERLTKTLDCPGITEIREYIGDCTIILRKGSADDVHAGSEIFEMETVNPDQDQRNGCFLKILPRGLMRRQFHYANFMPHRELCIYGDVLPHFRQFLTKSGLDGDSMLPQPRLYFGKLDLQVNKYECILALENLKTKGFMQAKNLQNCFCDEAHVRCVLQYLAYFHATSLAIKQKNGQEWPIFHTLPPGKRDPNTAKYLKTVISNVMKALASFREQSAQKLGRMMALVLEQNSEEKSTIECLLHGDAWINNYLFQYDLDDEPIKCATVDYQFAHYGHPATDLLQFLYTSVTTTLRGSKMNAWLKEYFSIFSGTLTQLDVDIKNLNWKVFKKEVSQRSFAGVIRACYALPVIMAMEKVNRSCGYDESNSEESAIEEMFRNNHSVDTMANNLQLMGIFSELIDEVLV